MCQMSGQSQMLCGYSYNLWGRDAVNSEFNSGFNSEFNSSCAQSGSQFRELHCVFILNVNCEGAHPGPDVPACMLNFKMSFDADLHVNAGVASDAIDCRYLRVKHGNCAGQSSWSLISL